MNFLKTLYKDAVGELRGLWQMIAAFAAKLWAAIGKFFVKIGKFLSGKFADAVKYVKGVSFQKRVIFGVAFYLLVFYLWQIVAFRLPQTAFVIVNLLLVTVVAGFITVMLFYIKRMSDDAERKFADEVALRKKKEKEIVSLKGEVHDMKMASRKQTTFGKNSQALIDSLHKNKAESKPGELPGQYILRSLVQNYEISCGLIYMRGYPVPTLPSQKEPADTGDTPAEDIFALAGTYALFDDPKFTYLTPNDGIAGQAIKSGKAQKIKDVPIDYINISSGLGTTRSLNLYVLPMKKKGVVEGVAEVASFGKLSLADIWPDIESVILKEE